LSFSKAIVTLAIGDRYLQHWKQTCEPNWRAYAARHGFDVICLDKPLDGSERARKRSPAWQKCLILSQDFAQHYERIVWLDADILINNHAAPAVDENVPLDKVGVAEEFTYVQDAGTEPRQLLDRLYSYWGRSVINYAACEYYTRYGFPDGFDKVVQTGVMVLSPHHHRALLEEVYNEYEEKGGAEWNYEMRPLSYELLKANVVHWIDRRFNQVWTYSLFLHYPFLVNPRKDNGLSGRLKNKLATALGAPSLATVQRACLTATFLNSFFFHISGVSMEQMDLVNQAATSYIDCVL
jgi:hypothetical protein